MDGRYENLFAKRVPAVIPFLMLGEPDAATMMARVDALVGVGASALELGIPFSDPVADGPVVVAAANRALAAGATPHSCLQSIAAIRARHPAMPIGLLVYANLVFARGLETFYREAARAGVDSVLVADAPLDEGGPFRAAASRADVAPVFIVPPDADDATLVAVGRAGAGYTYVTGRRGVTGAGGTDFAALASTIARLSACRAPPPVVGFGIDGPAAVRAAFASGAAGVIVGSALLERFDRDAVGAIEWFAGLASPSVRRDLSLGA